MEDFTHIDIENYAALQQVYIGSAASQAWHRAPLLLKDRITASGPIIGYGVKITSFSLVPAKS